MTRKGFSLIELLVVIAIIALLAAIIFPVFSTISEGNRAKSSMSNLHQISVAMGQFKLDTQNYPSVLFGTVYTHAGVTYPMDKVGQVCAANGDCSTSLTGLYPEYIKSVSTFNDPNDNAKLIDVTGALPTIAIQPDGTLLNTTSNFYKYDSYDSSPLVVGPNKIRTDMLNVPRYEHDWTDINVNFDCSKTTKSSLPLPDLCPDPVPYPANLQRFNYNRQLRWTNPPPDSYVTCSTWHVTQSDSVLVLFLNGNVKKMDTATFLGTGITGSPLPDVPIDGAHPQPDISAVNGMSRANFWKQRISLD